MEHDHDRSTQSSANQAAPAVKQPAEVVEAKKVAVAAMRESADSRKPVSAEGLKALKTVADWAATNIPDEQLKKINDSGKVMINVAAYDEDAKQMLQEDAKKAAAKPEATPVVSKQTKIIADLKSAWLKAGVNLEKLVEKQDGKFINLLVGEGWPVVQVGPTGGIALPEVRSYPKAFDAAVNGLELLKKQREREQKKAATATATPSAPPAQAAKPQPAAKPETPTAKKARKDAAIEAQLQQAAQ